MVATELDSAESIRERSADPSLVGPSSNENPIKRDCRRKASVLAAVRRFLICQARRAAKIPRATGITITNTVESTTSTSSHNSALLVACPQSTVPQVQKGQYRRTGQSGVFRRFSNSNVIGR